MITKVEVNQATKDALKVDLPAAEVNTLDQLAVARVFGVPVFIDDELPPNTIRVVSGGQSTTFELKPSDPGYRSNEVG